VVVVRCLLDNAVRRTSRDITKSSAVSRLPKGFAGVKGKIKPTLSYVLASPIRQRDDEDRIWGVVDLDASNEVGKKLLMNEKVANAVMLRLAKHLSTLLT
jgi:hypothetical protein